MSQNLHKSISMESTMPSNHLILCYPLSSCPQSFPASWSFPMSWLFSSGTKSIGTSALASVLPMGFAGDSADKESTCNTGDLGWILGLGRSPGEGKGYPLQYSGLENSKDCTVHGVAKSQTRLSNFHSLTHAHLPGRNTFKTRGKVFRPIPPTALQMHA